MSREVEALAAAIDGQNLYHGRLGTTPAGHTTAMAVLSVLHAAGWQVTRVGDEERLRGRRLVLVADDLLEKWGTRTERGERITAEWGEPDERGWYDPTFTVHADDRLVDEERLRAAATDVLREWDAFITTRLTGSRPSARPSDFVALADAILPLRAALAPQPPSPASQK